MVPRRFAVLLCAEDSEYVKTKYDGYFGIFKAMLGGPGETWVVFRAWRGELPNGEEEIEQYDGFVITGSCSDAHGSDPWILDLVKLLKKLDAMKKKILGICFGHQILGRALGGKVGRASSWDIGLRTVELSATSRFFSSLNLSMELQVIECHRDEVKELPPRVEVIASSDKTGIEMFRFGDHIMGIQGHPEYNQDILLHLIDRLLQKTLITETYASLLKTNIGSCEPDREAWGKLCVLFLKGTASS